MVGVFCRNWLKLRITVQPVMQEARVIEPKTQHRFVNSHESSVGELVWWAWLQPFARCIRFEVLQIVLTLVALPWAEEVFQSTPSTSLFRLTLGREVYEFFTSIYCPFCIITIIFTIITVFSPNHTHLMSFSVTAD